MKKILIGVLLVLVGGAFYFFFSNQNTPNLLDQNPKLYLYTSSGESLGGLSLSVPFTKASNDSYVIDVGIDLNKDGLIGESEWQIKDEKVRLIQNLKNNFWINDEARAFAVNDEVLLKINFKKSGEPQVLQDIEKKVKIEAFETEDIFGFKVEGAGEDLKRGVGLVNLSAQIAHAEGEEVFREGVTPDLAQGPMECAAVSAANSLMSLAGENDMLDNLPGFTGELIEELKTDMKYKNGITLENMVIGKNAFTQRHGLPIRTELKFAPTKEDILKALNSGAAVELSFSFVQSKSGRKNTGHVLTLIGGSQSQIFVHDSGTPEGMDTLNMFGTVVTPKNTFINVPYPLWDGTAFIDGIVIQNWTEPKHAEESYTDGGEQGSEVEMLVINKSYFPKSFFRVGEHGECKHSHYHGKSGDVAYGFKNKTSSEIISLSDPNPNSCGFGKVSEVPVEKITITFEQSQALAGYIPN